MKQILLLLATFFLLKTTTAQKEHSTKVLEPSPEWSVVTHKDQLKLTLIIDSVQIGNKVNKMNSHRTVELNFESDYIQIKDNLYLKIFVARNQEYGKKFYSWKWDYLKKTGNDYKSIGAGYYAPMEYNQPIPASGDYGQGIGIQGDSDYVMVYYRYKLE